MIRTAFIGAICASALPASAGAATENPHYCGSRFVTFAQLDSRGAATIIRTVRKNAVIRIIGHANGRATMSVKYGKTELSLGLPAGARERLVQSGRVGERSLRLVQLVARRPD